MKTMLKISQSHIPQDVMNEIIEMLHEIVSENALKSKMDGVLSDWNEEEEQNRAWLSFLNEHRIRKEEEKILSGY